jgi:pyridinium-3,5-biscarboxylic acid mononucleotide sulfurtransferase
MTGRMAMTAAMTELQRVLESIGQVAVAVSGGVDSMTLAVVAHRRLGAAASMLHAVSPAVPPEATARVRAYAEGLGWQLDVMDAGEFADPDYLRNPANRCYFCKTNLYGAMAARTAATLASGTNLDDLGDYRPGLQAATEHGVRHPFVEAGMSKAAVRGLARAMGLDDLAELPAAPCLSSRLETGIEVTAERLQLVHAVERLISEQLKPATVRCRLFHNGIAVQLDPISLAAIEGPSGAALQSAIQHLLDERGQHARLRFEPYRMGSAFHHPARRAAAGVAVHGE